MSRVGSEGLGSVQASTHLLDTDAASSGPQCKQRMAQPSTALGKPEFGSRHDDRSFLLVLFLARHFVLTLCT